MGPIKLKLGSMPKPAAPAPVPGAPPVMANNSTRPTAAGAQSIAVKSPKAKNKNIDGMAKSDLSNKGVSKLKIFMDNRSLKKNKVSAK